MFRFILLFTVIFLLNSCIATKYMGFYELSKDSENFANRHATAKDFYFVIDTLEHVGKEFGFVETDQKDRTNWYSSYDYVDLFKKRSIKSNYDYLSGSDSTMDIFMVKDPKSISILVRDWKNYSETDFIKALKARLEEELSKGIDMKKVQFRRKVLSMN